MELTGRTVLPGLEEPGPPRPDIGGHDGRQEHYLSVRRHGPAIPQRYGATSALIRAASAAPSCQQCSAALRRWVERAASLDWNQLFSDHGHDSQMVAPLCELVRRLAEREVEAADYILGRRQWLAQRVLAELGGRFRYHPQIQLDAVKLALRLVAWWGQRVRVHGWIARVDAAVVTGVLRPMRALPDDAEIQLERCRFVGELGSCDLFSHLISRGGFELVARAMQKHCNEDLAAVGCRTIREMATELDFHKKRQMRQEPFNRGGESEDELPSDVDDIVVPDEDWEDARLEVQRALARFPLNVQIQEDGLLLLSFTSRWP